MTERIINQRVEHSSLRSENFNATYVSDVSYGNETFEAARLCFISLRITFAREQNGDRGAGEGSPANQRRLRGVYWE